MTTVDALASLQQLRATFAGLTGGGIAMNGSTGSDSTTSSTDFDDLIASMSATSAATSSTTQATASAVTASSTDTSAASSTAGVTGSLVSDGTVTGADVVADAKKYIGVPYVFGGESTSGMDCSGLVQKTFKDLGVSLTRGVSTQKLQGQAVDGLANAKPGDLIVFKGGGHIAIYAGNDMVIHAPYPGRKVSLQKLWVGDAGIETIRRVVPSTSSAKAATAAASLGTSAVTAATSTSAGATASTAGTAASSSGTVTLAQAQAALAAAQTAIMQADMAMMSGTLDTGVSDTDSTTDSTSSSSATDSTGTGATSTAGVTAAAGSADAIQQFIAAQEALMSQGAS